MMELLVRRAHQMLNSWRTEPPAERPVTEAVAAPAGDYQPLQRLVLSDGVSRVLFDEFAEHRRGSRGEEETGWLLLGLRQQTEAIALATLPAGAQREAGVAHVQFHAAAQAVGSRIIRQSDRRLGIVGVVHTHPGSLRHPSRGDYQGDRHWVRQLRGGEGVFGIGTADAVAEDVFAHQPKPSVQCLGKLCFSWYALAEGDERYRPLPVALTLGPNLARDLHPAWPTLEAHAERLERLARQQVGARFEVTKQHELLLTLPLAEPGDALRVLLQGKNASYFLMKQGDILAANPGAVPVDQGVYQLLAELAAQS